MLSLSINLDLVSIHRVWVQELKIYLIDISEYVCAKCDECKIYTGRSLFLYDKFSLVACSSCHLDLCIPNINNEIMK